MVTIQQGLREEGFVVSMVKLCRWFGVARRSVYYRSTKAPAKVKPALAEPIKALIEAEPRAGPGSLNTKSTSDKWNPVGQAAC